MAYALSDQAGSVGKLTGRYPFAAADYHWTIQVLEFVTTLACLW
jgi:hypothetical protein